MIVGIDLQLPDTLADEEELGVALKEEEMTPDNLDSVNKITRFVEAKRKAA